jgi:4-amino-4-deoxy-L-arabinose transferase-like glycosyltransferase
VGREFSRTFYLVHLPWFALPTLPLALWAVWHNRRALLKYTGMSLPLVSFLIMFLVLSASSSIRNIYALPMLLPLALLAALGLESLPDPGRRVLNQAGLWLFGILGLVLWSGWIAVMTGSPASLSRWLHVQQPDYSPSFRMGLFIIAGIYTLLWIYGILRSPRFEHHEAINWTAGMIFGWGLCMTIWLPWLDAGSGYRDMFISMKQKIPAQCSYILAQGLGESERAMLEYYTGVLPRMISQNEKDLGDCDILLVQSGGDLQDPPKGVEWEFLWEQWRPNEPQDLPKEVFTLLKRKEGKRNCR